VCYTNRMALLKLPKLSKQQLDQLERARRGAWLLAVAAAVILAGFFYFLNSLTPPPLGHP
jgi:hypothetical protein